MKAFVDTTVVTDALLKSGEQRERAVAGLARYDETLLPTYAIKEFKAGPLLYHAWWHNKLATSASFGDAVVALHAMSRTPRRYQTSTALESQIAAAASIAHETPNSLAAKYGGDTSIDIVMRDEFRIATKTLIFKAWARRRSLTSAVVQPLACYLEMDPRLVDGLIDVAPTRCTAAQDCCLGDALKQRKQDLEKLRVAAQAGSRREDQARAQALRGLLRKPKNPLSQADCRSLGDAVFAFFAPADADILTTNVRDHGPLAASLGKTAVRP